MLKIYLAIPYSGMEESSFEQANEATVALLNMGFNVFSPITHSHPLTRHDLPGTWDFWKKIDYQFLDWCDILLILIPKEGTEKVTQSVGVGEEVKYYSESKPPRKQIIHSCTIDNISSIKEVLDTMSLTFMINAGGKNQKN